MKFLLISLLLPFTVLSQEKSCIPPHQFYPFEGPWATRNDNGDITLGMYARVSPDGKYVLRSFSGKKLSQVTLMELIKNEKGNSVKPYETPLNNEAFPVQGSWRYIEDIGGEHYKFTDLLKLGKKAKKQFKGGISGFYTVAAEIPGGNAKKHKIRSLSWPNTQDNQGVGVLTNMVITAGIDKNGIAEKIDSTGINYMCANLKNTDGHVMSLPMISTDASEFASMPQNPKNSEPSMRIYRFGSNNKDCEKILDLNVMAAKIIFSMQPQNQVLFYSSGSITNKGNGVHFYDRSVEKMFTLDDAGKKIKADSYPGFTADGRIVYGAYWEECQESGCQEKAGYIVSDPYQSPDVIEYKKDHPEMASKFKECITKDDVLKAESDQKKIWSYSL